MTRQAAIHELVFVDEPPAPLRAPTAPRKGTPAPRSPLQTYVAPDSHRAHGTYVKYVVEKCRCLDCRAANREYENKRVHAMNRPDEVWLPYVPATRARAHLLELQAQGVGYKTVADLAGLSQSAVGKILWPTRYRRMSTSKRIRPETEAKILAVTVEMASGGQKVPAGRTWELIEDLVTRGWPKSWIARELGSKAKSNHPGLQIRRDVVRASTARAVEQLHARLAGQEGPGKRSRWDSR